MKIAIIGGSGFIGTRLATILEERSVDFIIIDKEIGTTYPERTFVADVRDTKALKQGLQGIDIVVNLAAEHRDDVMPKSLYYDVNVTGAENVCTVAAELGIRRIVFTSSVAVYGFASPYTDESASCTPFNDYGRTKLRAEGVYTAWANETDERKLAVVRPTVVFGEDNRGNVYNLFHQIAKGSFLFVGSGKNHKAMAYVGNVATFLSHIIASPELNGTWNYVDTPIPDMKELVTVIRSKLGKGSGTGIRIPSFLGLFGGICFDILAKITRRRFPISRIRVKKFLSESSFSAQKALNTNFIAPFDLQEAIERVLEYEFIDKGHTHA